MRNKIWKCVSLIVVVSMLLSACGGSSPKPVSTDPAQAAPVQPAPNGTAPATKDVSIATPNGTPEMFPMKVVPIGSNELLPPGTTIINLEMSPETKIEFQNLSDWANQQLAAGRSIDEISVDSVFVGALLGLLMNGIANSTYCQKIGNDLGRHTIEDNLSRTGGWQGVENFKNALLNKEISIKAIFSSFTKWRTGIFYQHNGKNVLLVLTTESRSTVIPFAASLSEEIVTKAPNFLKFGRDGTIVAGMAFGKEAGWALNTGVYALDQAMEAAVLTGLVAVGKCLENYLKESEPYKQWKARSQKQTKEQNDKEARNSTTYSTPEELVADIQLLQRLGIANNLVSNDQIEVAGQKIALVAGATTAYFILAPVIIPAGGIFGVTEESIRYTLILSVAP